MVIIAEYGYILLILACAFGFFMAWGIGANDVANAMGTSVGSKALTIKQAILIAIIFEFAGAFLAGGSVTSTIRKGIIDSDMPILVENPELLIYGMLSSLLAAAIWLLVASKFGWPVSTTHSIVGAIVGFAAIGLGFDAVHWGQVGSIVASWVVSPVLAGAFAFAIFTSIHKLILNTQDPFSNAKRYAPMYMFLVGFMIAMVTLEKGLKNVGLDFSSSQNYIISFVSGAIVFMVGKLAIKNIHYNKVENKEFAFSSVEKIFGVLMIFTAAAMAFAHGSNDVANAVGPMAAIIGIIASGGEVAAKSELPAWILLIGGMGIVVGLATLGYKVMATIGKKITELTPSRGFSAELAAATTVVLASGTGLPISTTHTLVGAVLGVGIARGIGALNLRSIGTIFTSWLVTLPAGALLSVLFFYFFKGLFSSI